MSSGPGNSSRSIAVVGGGITGLCAAYRLVQRGHRVRLFEASDRLGGVIRTERKDGWLIENGPNSFQENSREISALIAELGLESEVLEANRSANNRYVVREGKLCALPRSPWELLHTPLFSARSKLQLLTELFTRPRERSTDLSLADLVTAHFGQEIAEYALNPFVSGVYAGDARKLSARYAFPSLWQNERSHGSLIRGFISQAKARRRGGQPKARVISFRGGLQALVDALAQRLPPETIELNAAVDRLTPGERWKISWSQSSGGSRREEEFSSTILALPARGLAALTFSSGKDARPLVDLSAVEYPPVASLFLGFRREQIAHSLDGFGALVPTVEHRKLLGVIFSSSLFPGRAPPGHVALNVMMGGSLQPEITRLKTEELLAEILPELQSLLGARRAPVFCELTVWPHAIPQYNLGHERVLQTIAEVEGNHRGLLIGGQIKDGISLPACALAGFQLAERAIG